MPTKKPVAVLVACALLFLLTQQTHAKRFRIAPNWNTKSCNTCSSTGTCPGGVCHRVTQAVTKKREERKHTHVDGWLLRKVFGADTSEGHQPVLLVFGSRATCGHCRVLDTNLNSDKVQAQLKKEGVQAVICDDSEAPIEVFNEFGAANSMPKTVLGSLDAKGEITIYRESFGEMTPDELITFMQLPQESPAAGG